MPRPDGRIEPGQPLRGAISARAWNRAQDAADLVLGANPSTEGVPGSPVLKPYTWAYCRPSVTVARWGVLAITGVAITPTSSAGGATASFEEMPVITGYTPDAATTAWCVAVEPIESGTIGKVAVDGVVQCKVADLGKARGAHVLWKDSAWALIRIGVGVVSGTFTGDWGAGQVKTVTHLGDSSITYAVGNQLGNFRLGSNSTECTIAFSNGGWTLISVNFNNLYGRTGQSVIHVLGSDADSSALQWIPTTTCS